jgi:CubicO group peptidase (beta-lactamase class C family)
LFKYKLMFFLLLHLPAVAFSADLPSEKPVLATNQNVSSSLRIDQLIESSIQKGLISGGVILIGNRDRTLFEKAYGHVAPTPAARPMTVDTVFDLASLTKVIATTPAILKLAEGGKVSLVDPVKKWFPEFEGKGKDDLLVMHLLTHTSGFDDFALVSEKALQSAVEGAAGQTLKGEVGNRFHYADINFILLGEMVRRVSGEALNDYTARTFYQPLGMKATGFLPSIELKSRAATTVGDGPLQFIGDPQDYLARQMGGVAGHAGLFSSSADLAVFCRMMLSGGRSAGMEIMAARTVNQMTAPYFSRNGKVARGLGWDIASPYSAPRGGFFSRSSFGHTGYSGTSIWLDPEADLFVIVLTTRLEFRKKAEFSQLRSELSTLAVESFGTPVSLKELEEDL